MAAPYKTGVITAITLIGGVNVLVQLFDHKAEQRRTAEAREEAARKRDRAEARARARKTPEDGRAEAAERENAELRLRIADLEQNQNGK